MTNFIQPAFIRNDTPELRARLEELGYELHDYGMGHDLSGRCSGLATTTAYKSYVPLVTAIFDSNDPMVSWNTAGRTDCGTNEKLFLAIAALRNDTDRYQWFVLDVNFARTDEDEIYPKGSFVRCMKDRWNEDGVCVFSSRNIPAHKAKVEELIEHFKEK